MTHVGMAIDEIDGQIQDLYLDDDGNLAMVYGAHAVGQHVKQRIKTFEGEWFLDTSAGVPWLSEILNNNNDQSLAETLIKSEIVKTDGVAEITSFSISFDRVRRLLSAYDIDVVTTYDQEVSV